MSRTATQVLISAAAEAAVRDGGFRPTDPAIVKAVGDVAQAVDAALDEKMDLLRQAARNLGATDAQVSRIFTEAGLDHDPEPEPEVEAEDAEPESKKGKRLAALEEKFEALQEKFNQALDFARSNGFRG